MLVITYIDTSRTSRVKLDYNTPKHLEPRTLSPKATNTKPLKPSTPASPGVSEWVCAETLNPLNKPPKDMQDIL